MSKSEEGAKRKRPLPSKKKEERETVAEELVEEVEVEAVPEEELDPNEAITTLLARMEELENQNNALTSELNKKDVALKALAAQAPEDGGRRLVRGGSGDEFKLPVEDEPKEDVEFAVFRSPYPGFRQVYQKGKKIRYDDGESDLIPPKVAQFDQGVCVLYDPEEIELMRAKMEWKKKRGQVEFIELIDPEVKEAARKGTRSVVSPTVTVDTPAESLI